MDEIKITDIYLENTKEEIKKYSIKQSEVLKKFYDAVRNLADIWEGNNFNTIFYEVEMITNMGSSNFFTIGLNYSKYFQEKVEQFYSRPTFGSISSQKSAISNSNSKVKDATKSLEKENSPKSIYEKIFAAHNKDLVQRLYFYLKKIHFYNPVDKISYYDPSGLSKGGLYKNIIAVDINSKDFAKQLIKLTGQHLYFAMNHIQRSNLLYSLSKDMKNQKNINLANLTAFGKTILSGNNINFKYLGFLNENEKAAFSFFSNCFSSYMFKDNDLDKYKKYFSYSYQQFVSILNNLQIAK